jgi:hypothetical protein
MILTDNETKVDLPNNEPIAATIIKLLGDRRSDKADVVRPRARSERSPTPALMFAAGPSAFVTS